MAKNLVATHLPDWKAFSSASSTVPHTGFSFCLCWPSVHVHAAFFNGYTKGTNDGEITEMSDSRTIVSIDGQPAAKVYNSWAKSKFFRSKEDMLAHPEGMDILASSTEFPLGVKRGLDWEHMPFYQLLHPSRITTDQHGEPTAVQTFCDAKVGDRIQMMLSVDCDYKMKVCQVIKHVVRNSTFSVENVQGAHHQLDRLAELMFAGAIVVYCGGCMLGIKQEMKGVAEKIQQSLGGGLGGNYKPVLGLHTFGELGCFPDGRNAHGNLMFSCLVFSNR